MNITKLLNWFHPCVLPNIFAQCSIFLSAKAFSTSLNGRFVEVYNYYSAVFESLDATMSRENPDRMNVEKQCLARDIVNIVACEGADRIER